MSRRVVVGQAPPPPPPPAPARPPARAPAHAGAAACQRVRRQRAVWARGKLDGHPLRGSSPRPVAHETIALATELREHDRADAPTAVWSDSGSAAGFGSCSRRPTQSRAS